MVTAGAPVSFDLPSFFVSLQPTEMEDTLSGEEGGEKEEEGRDYFVWLPNVP